MNQQFVDKITQKIPELKLFFDEPMKNHTTFRIGGTADVYVQPDDMQLKILLETARETDMPVTVIGNGSNLLVGDFGIRGLVIEIGKGMKDITISGKTITASAGAGLGAAASKAAEAGLCGMEFASGIPGNIGGAVVMNAGAYGGEIKQIIKNATVITLDGQIKTLSADELELSYRHSCIPENNYIVISAVFTLEDGVDEAGGGVGHAGEEDGLQAHVLQSAIHLVKSLEALGLVAEGLHDLLTLYHLVDKGSLLAAHGALALEILVAALCEEAGDHKAQGGDADHHQRDGNILL